MSDGFYLEGMNWSIEFYNHSWICRKRLENDRPVETEEQKSEAMDWKMRNIAKFYGNKS